MREEAFPVGPKMYRIITDAVKTQYINDDRDFDRDSNFYVHDPLQANISRTRFQAKENVKKKRRTRKIKR